MNTSRGLRALCIAGRFLTRLPFPDCRGDDSDLGASVVYYPIIGLLVGGLLAAASWVTSILPTEIAATLILILWILATGILHLDGLADSADALVGGLGGRERSLEIMKDPAVGTAGVVALILLLMSKWAGLQLLLEQGRWLGLLAVPVLSRALLIPLFLTTPCARKEGLAVELAATIPRRLAWSSAGLAFAGGMIMLGAAGPLGCGFAIALVYGLRRVAMRRLGGITGDTAGALIEIAEAGLLLVVALVVGGVFQPLLVG